MRTGTEGGRTALSVFREARSLFDMSAETMKQGKPRSALPVARRLACLNGQKQHGFTLLEMMVVLLIVGLLVAVVALAPARNRRTELAEEAQRLASLLESAGDEAQVRSTPMAWQPIAGGYRFYRRTDDGAWQPVADELFSPHRWSTDVTGVSVRYTGSNEPVSRVVFGDESIGVPVTITLSSAGVRLLVVGTGIGNFVVRRP